MKGLKYIVAGLCLFLCCSFAENDWVVFLSHDSTFRVSFPHEPEVLKHIVDSGIIPVRSRLVKYDVGKFKDENVSYQLIYSDYPDSIVNSDFKTRITDTFLKTMIFQERDEIKGRIISIEEVKYKEFPGRHVHYTFGGRYALNMMIYLVKSRLYMLKIQCDITNDNNPAIEQFFNSFEVLDKPVKAPVKGKSGKK